MNVNLLFLSLGVRRHSGKTSPFTAGMKAEPRTVVKQKLYYNLILVCITSIAHITIYTISTYSILCKEHRRENRNAIQNYSFRKNRTLA